jgi:hypothetical protein
VPLTSPLVVGCGGDSDRGGDAVREILEKIGQPPPPAGEITEEPPTLTPLVEQRPLWDGTGANAVSTVRCAVLRGETAVIVGDVNDDFRLAAVEAATGRQHWRIEEFSPCLAGTG